MWNTIIIIAVPDQGYPGDICLIKNFMQMLEEETLVLNVQVNHSKTSFVLSSAHQVPSSQRLLWNIATPPPHALSEYSVQLLDDTTRDLQTAEEVDWHRGQN